MRGAIAIGLALLSGCLEHEVRPCSDGTVCETGQICKLGGGCAYEEFRTACEGLSTNANCSATDPKTEMSFEGHCIMGVCSVTVCGDSVVTIPETCDDGNTLPDDGCSPTCMGP